MAAEVKRLMLEAEGTADVEVDSAHIDAVLPLDLPTYEDARWELEGKERALAKAMDEGCYDEDRRTWEIDSRMEELAAAKRLLWFKEKNVAAISAEIQVLKFADIVILGIPGELYTEIGLSIKGNSPSKNTIISTVTNDYIGYIPTKEEFGKNPVPSMLGFTPEMPAIIEGSALEAIETLH